MLVGAVYIPPCASTDLYSSFCDAVEEVCHSLVPGTLVFIAGDLNQPATSWIGLPGPDVSAGSRHLLDMADFLQLSQINRVTNARGVLLDLVFSSNPDLHVLAADDPLVNLEDAHPALIADIWIHRTFIATSNVLVPNFKKCNLHEVYTWIQRQPYAVNSSSSDVEDLFTGFCEELKESIILNCPLRRVGQAKFPQWFSGELKNLVKRKKFLHKRFKTTQHLEDFNKFREVRGQCKRLARICHSNYISSVDQNLKSDPKSFWRHVRTVGKQQSAPGLLRLDAREAKTSNEICELFADFFASTYKTSSSEAPNYRYSTGICLAAITVSATDVEKKLRSLDPTKSSGPDDISAMVLKHCCEPLAPILAVFFNALLRAGIFPGILKQGFLVPIHKSGEHSNVKNYRPIVIQPALAKVFEGLVLDRMSFAFKNIIVPQQHGFRQGRSTVTNLVVFVNNVLSAFNNGNQLDCIYLDFAKAFDRISHPHLLQKLDALGVHGSLLRWFKSYLSNRTLQVRHSQSVSRPILVTSGVPQGSHLGPFLFSIFINDIGDFIKGKFLLFADDVKVFSEVSMIQHQSNLQNDLYGVEQWCRRNEMDLNTTKCSIMTYSRSRQNLLFDYHLGDLTIGRVDRMKDLGVLMKPNLDPGDHISSVCSRANSTLGLISRMCRNGFSISSMRTLYVALVRPIIEFSNTVWAPHQVGHCSHLDDVQRRFLRLVGVRLGHRYLDVNLQEMEQRLNLHPLTARRTLLDLLFLYRVLNNQIDCPDILHVLHFHVPRHTRHPQLFSKNFHPTNYAYYGPLPRLMRLGNEVYANLDFVGISPEAFKRGALRLILVE